MLCIYLHIIVIYHMGFCSSPCTIKTVELDYQHLIECHNYFLFV